MVLALVRGKVSATFLGVGGVGVVSQLNYIATWAGGLATMGMSSGCIRELARARARGEEGEIRQIVFLAISLPLVIGVILTLVTVGVSTGGAAVLLGQKGLAWAFTIACASVPLNLLAGSISVIAQGFEHIGRLAVTTLVANVINTVLVVTLILVLGLKGGIVGVTATSVVTLLVLWVRMGGPLRLGLSRPIPWPSKSIVAKVAGLGIASFLLGFSSSTGDLVIRSRVVHVLGIAGMGLYQPVYAMSNQYLIGFIGTTSVYLFPTLSRLLAEGRRTEALGELNTGLRLLLVAFTPVILALILAAPLVLGLLYAPAFTGGAAALRVQLVGDVLKIVAYSVGAVLLPLGFTRRWLAIGLSTVAINVGAAWLLAPIFGLTGITFSYMLAWLANAGLTIIALRKSGTWFSRRSWVLCLAAVASVATEYCLVALPLGRVGDLLAAALLVGWLIFSGRIILRKISARPVPNVDPQPST